MRAMIGARLDLNQRERPAFCDHDIDSLFRCTSAPSFHVQDSDWHRGRRNRQLASSGLRPTGERAMKTCAGAAAILLMFGGTAHAQALQPDQQRGFTYVRVHCAQCHSIDKVTPSPLGIAPPFRTLHRRYPVENLAEALAEGIVTGHPSMPEFRLEPDQIVDVISYLKTLER
jgi:cytochrome c